MKTIRNLSRANNRKNPTRSILIIIAVIISSLLLTAISLFGYSTVTFQQKNAKELYGSYYGIYAGVTDEQITELKRRSEIDKIGNTADVGVFKGKGNRNVKWLSSSAQKMENMKRQLKSGKFPEKENEILMQSELLEELGYKNAKEGDKIKVSFRRNEREPFSERSFILSGIMKPQNIKTINSNYTSYVSEAFYQNEYEEGGRVYSVYFSLQEYLEPDSDSATEIAKEVGKSCGIESNQIAMNDYYLFWGLKPDRTIIFGCVLVALLVIAISIMVIYNIFQVGIQWKIREYGKIKALGTTKKQMKQLILNEGLSLAVPAIPIGMILGVLFNFFVMNLYIKKTIEEVGMYAGTEISIFSVPILILCFAVTLIGVIISLLKPMKTVSCISPVEAMRYQETDKRAKGIRKGYKEMSLWRMLKANMSANRKRNTMIVIMLGVSCILFVILGSFMSSISIEEETRRAIPYGDFEVSLDYSLDEEVYVERNLDHVLDVDPLSKKKIEEIRKIDGVNEVKVQNIFCGEDKDGIIYDVAVFDRDTLEKNIKSLQDIYGVVDYDKITEKNALLYGGGQFYTETGYDLGDTINMQLTGYAGNKKYSGKMIGSLFSLSETNWIMTEDTFKNLGLKSGQEKAGLIWVSVAKEKESAVSKELQKMVKEDENLQMKSYKEQYMQNEKAYNLIRLLGYGLLFFIGVITFLNLANSSLMNMVTKKKELGVMQALGMTNKQLGKMLCSESLIISAGSLLLALVIGMPVGYFAVIAGKKACIFGLTGYHLPVIPVLTLILVVLIFQCVLSFIISRNVKKESIIERIRYQE